jgi:hypothetical protein
MFWYLLAAVLFGMYLAQEYNVPRVRLYIDQGYVLLNHFHLTLKKNINGGTQQQH